MKNVESQAKKLVEMAVSNARRGRGKPGGFVPKTREEITALAQQQQQQIAKIIGSTEDGSGLNGTLNFDDASYSETEGSLSIPTSTGSEISVLVIGKGVAAPDGQVYSSPEWREFDFYMDMTKVVDISPTEVMVISQM